MNWEIVHESDSLIIDLQDSEIIALKEERNMLEITNKLFKTLSGIFGATSVILATILIFLTST
jgi:hypothetical protein